MMVLIEKERKKSCRYETNMATVDYTETRPCSLIQREIAQERSEDKIDK